MPLSSLLPEYLPLARLSTLDTKTELIAPLSPRPTEAHRGVPPAAPGGLKAEPGSGGQVGTGAAETPCSPAPCPRLASPRRPAASAHPRSRLVPPHLAPLRRPHLPATAGQPAPAAAFCTCAPPGWSPVLLQCAGAETARMRRSDVTLTAVSASLAAREKAGRDGGGRFVCAAFCHRGRME